MQYYFVSFEYAESLFCTNIAHAKSVNDVMRHYSDYNCVSVTAASDRDVESAKKKGMPIIEINSKEENK